MNGQTKAGDFHLDRELAQLWQEYERCPSRASDWHNS